MSIPINPLDKFDWEEEPQGAKNFARRDERDDALFYSKQRPGPHLDSEALGTVKRIIETLTIEEHPAVLDLMASVDSHLPGSLRPSEVVGLGLNAEELAANPALASRVVHDLNADPRIPLQSCSFDLVLNTVSIDYLTHPSHVFKEVSRVLKPGGLFLVIFSNRYFPEKVVKIWKESSEEERVLLVEELFLKTFSFEPPRLFVSRGRPRPPDDKYAHLEIPSDPVYALYAERKGRPFGMPVRPALNAAEERPLLSAEEFKKRKKKVGETMTCPYCEERLSKWEVPQHPFSEWDTEFMYICFNDRCPYYVRGWDSLSRQGTLGVSYRLLYNPVNGAVMPIPVNSSKALKSGIIKE